MSYIFFNIRKHNLTLKSLIAKDDTGLLKYFGDYLNDNLIREAILKFMDAPQIPKISLNELRLQRAENSIAFEGEVFAIKFRNRTIRLQNEVSIRDLIYIIMNKVSNQNALVLWRNLRVKDNPKIDDVIAFGNIQRNKNRLIKKLKDIEIKMNIPLPERFSKFVDNHIILDSSLCSISYEAPQEIQWEFDLPQNIFQE